MSKPDPIEEQLQKRLFEFNPNLWPPSLRFPSVLAMSESATKLARECAMLRRLCREAEDYLDHDQEGNRPLRAKLEAAANGEEVDDG